ncbi:hypothetical protein H8N01_12790 [Streptomyces sp. AC536]|uniref:hypothetical protein n=1 Tax=Streptomyces buecherae TaxID=2763006 RepID=UPI00164D219C|nr:hypothetical protein [Streptomyces buecherae]MBC3983413.1 hypothetical protein [Streptomyces buecherae]QNJ43334.1 hypothetical protein H7H31_29325 [Streptomyces buecherae]
MTATTMPGEVLSAVQPVSSRLVAERRGSTVWEAESKEHGRVAVKVGAPIDEEREYTALACDRGGTVKNLHHFPYPGCLVRYEAPKTSRQAAKEAQRDH